MHDQSLRDYYARRAGEYEKIYRKPERQEDLGRLAAELSARLRGRSVLELACGTGYWSARIAPAATRLVGLDQSAEVLEIARAKNLPNARFEQGDAYAPQPPQGPYDAGFAGFWWSHVPRRALPGFLAGFHACLAPGARVVFIDNIYVEGSSTPLARRDEQGDTYQTRRLENGESYEVLKNFPDDAELKTAVAPFAREVEIVRLRYFWLLDYRLG